MDQASGYARCEERVTTGHDPNRTQQLLGLGVLDEKAAGPRAERLEHVFVGLERGQDHHPDTCQSIIRGNPAGGFDAVGAWHPDIHEHDVREQTLGQGHRCLAIGCFADNFDVLLACEDGAKAGPDERLVVSQQNPDHGLLPVGNVARTR